MNAMQVTDRFLFSVADAINTYLTSVALYPKMGLFTGAPSLGPLTVLADLAALEVTFTGYARVDLAPGALRKNANNDYILPFAPASFQPSAGGGTLPQTATGYFILTRETATDWLMSAEYFDAPFVFVDEFSGLTIQADLYVVNQTVWGGLCSQC